MKLSYNRGKISLPRYQMTGPIPGKVGLSLRSCQWHPIDPTHMIGYFHCFGYPLELEGKTLLLKIPYTWVMGHGENKMVLTWKLQASWLAFIVLQGSVFTAKEESNQQGYPDISSANYNNDWPGKICPLVQCWHEHYGRNWWLRNVPPRLQYLNVQSPLGVSVWQG